MGELLTHLVKQLTTQASNNFNNQTVFLLIISSFLLKVAKVKQFLKLL